MTYEMEMAMRYEVTFDELLEMAGITIQELEEN